MNLNIENSDFKPIETTIRISNTTTGVEVPMSTPSKIVEFLVAKLVLEIPSKSCAKNHRLTLDINIMDPYTQQKVDFECTTVVENIEKNVDDSYDRVECSLVQYEEKKWDELLSFFSSKQEKINEFLKGVKGY